MVGAKSYHYFFMDSKFQVSVISSTPDPQKVIYCAMHQDYSGEYIKDTTKDERMCGQIIVDNLLKGDRGHYGCCEHPSITFSCGYFPHSVMQQARTHRVGVTFDVQSYRYTSGNVIAVAEDKIAVQEAFYLRPSGNYRDREGSNYHYSVEQRSRDILYCKRAAIQYKEDVANGMPLEMARGKLPFDYRQHFIVSFNVRSLMHFLDLRAKKDAQLEIQQLCELMWPSFAEWVPDIANWYKEHRKGKARLAP